VVSPKPKKKTSSRAASAATTNVSDFNSFFNVGDSDPFPAVDFDQTDNFFRSAGDDISTGSGHPFFSQSNNQRRDQFDPRNYKTESGR
jgi:hypothetical protein